MSQVGSDRNLFDAVRQLAESEIQLIRVIEESTMDRQKSNTSMAPTSKRKNNKKLSKVRPSTTLLEAKREATRAKMLQKKASCDTFVRDIYQKVVDMYGVTRKQTGLVFDYAMEKHRCLWDENYPENPARLNRILERCKELGLLDRCKFIEARLATEHEILQMHEPMQLNTLKATSEYANKEEFEALSSKYDSIFIHPSTYEVSLLAVGSTINLVESICKEEVQNGMAIIRPPGHHAMKSEYCGYCFFNNVAIAAEKALNDNLVTKILIVDWDVHHGQATQRMFYKDPRVVYFSIHRYENGEFWPNLEESDFNYVGKGLGEGYNFNVPLNKTHMTNADYIAIFHQVLLPMAYEFQPDLIIISAGYDAALGCPEGEMKVTPACYSHLLYSLLSLAGGKIAVILEGGYCLKSLAESAALTLRTLLGDPCPTLHPLQLPSISIRDSILNTIYAHRNYWKCYQYQDLYSINDNTVNNEETDRRYLPVVSYKGTVQKTNVYPTRNCYPVQSKETIEAFEKELSELIKFTNLSKAPNKVCIVYDDNMLKHRDVSGNAHPENPNRILSIYKKHEEYNLLKRCLSLKGRLGTKEEILLVHSQEYVNAIKESENLSSKELEKQASKYKSVYLHESSWTSACTSVGSLLQVVDSVLKGESQAGVAIVRPPGHHAEQNLACGFCIFNNVAIAARYALKIYHIKRILIVDWDVHHGNGTQSIFESDPSVLYMSIHRYDNGDFFPKSKYGNYTSVGSGAGKGYCVNVPWNEKGMGNSEYIAAFQQIVMPIAYQFNPEFVLVSAGFDACIGDPLGGCSVTPEMYGHLTHWLSSLANGRIVLSLEGGYNVNSISHATAICTKALLGDPLPLLEPSMIPCPSAVRSIKNVLRTHEQYWCNLMFNIAFPKEDTMKVHAFEKQSESKIVLEGIENEKLGFELSFDKNGIDLVTVKEIQKLQNEMENIKIKNSIISDAAKNMQDSECSRHCVNKGQRRECREFTQNAGTSSSTGDNEGNQRVDTDGFRTSTSTNLTDYLSENLQALITGEMFAVVPLRECPHLSSVREVPPCGIDVHLPCTECVSIVENWICLQCYSVHCARSVNRHALLHANDTRHPMTLSFSDLSVWCYECEAYIDNPQLYTARNAAHQSKFKEELPWTYDKRQ